MPIWIPRETILAKSLLIEAHKRSLHRGNGMSLAMVNPNHRIIGARKTMKTNIKFCKECYLRNAQPIQQPIGSLATHQIKLTIPFENIVMDCFGPIQLINNKKCYILIMMCQSCKALKIGVLENMTSQTLIDVLLSLYRIS